MKIHSLSYGFSIVEFLISMSIGLIVLGSVTSIYVANKTSTNIQNAIALLQNNGRYLSYETNKHLRMAGYQGCISPNNMNINNIVNTSNSNYDKINFNTQIYGYNGSSSGGFSPLLPTHLQNINIKANTDVIEVRYADDINIRLGQDMTSASSSISLIDTDGDGDLREGLAQGDIFIITDCESGDIVSAGGGVNSSTIQVDATQNTTSSLSKAYTTKARIYQMRYFAFYIKDTGRVNNTGSIIYGLYQMDINGAETELSDGIEDVQLQYGVDTSGNGSVDTYYDADSVSLSSNWPQVKSLKINRLLNSINEVDSQNRSYFYNGALNISSDRLIRREWANFISLRNRSFP